MCMCTILTPIVVYLCNRRDPFLAEAASPYVDNSRDDSGGRGGVDNYEWVQREVRRQYQRRGGLRRTPLVIGMC